jgi:phosphomannomutase
MFSSYFPELDTAINLDGTDGVRVTLGNSDVVHLRPSGNAPELRCYTESHSIESAQKLNEYCINIMKKWRV